MREAPEARAVEINGQRAVTRHQHVDAHVKFLVPDQQRVVDVALHDVGFRLVGRVRPLAYFSHRFEQEDAFALAAADLSDQLFTGFIIQTTFWSLYLLNSSAKMGYSLGMLYVSGR